MNCNEVKNYIDRIVFEENTTLIEEVHQHIDGCSACKVYYEEGKSAKNIIELLKNQEPELKDPEQLTDNILHAISEPEAKRSEPEIPARTRVRTMTVIQRTLVAASVAMIIMFGFEQYMLVDKVKKLEIKVSYASKKLNLPDFKILFSLNAGLNHTIAEALMKPLLNKSNKPELKTRLKLARLSSLDIHDINLRRYRQLRYSSVVGFKEYFNNR